MYFSVDCLQVSNFNLRLSSPCLARSYLIATVKMMNFSCRRKSFTFSVIRRSDDLILPQKMFLAVMNLFHNILLTNFFTIIFQDLAKDASFRKPREALAVLPPNPGTRSNYAGSVNFGLVEINFLLEFNKEIVKKHPF